MRARFQDLSIRSKLTVIIASAVALLTAAMLVMVWVRAEREVRQDIQHELADSQTAFTAMEASHLREHAAETLADAAQPGVANLLRAGDRASACAFAADFIRRAMAEAGHTDTFDYVALQARDGSVLSLALRGYPACSPRPLRWRIADVRGALAGVAEITNWESPDHNFYEIIAAPVPGAHGSLGTLSLGFQITDAFARSVQAQTGTQVAFWHMDGAQVHVLAVSTPGLKLALVRAIEGRSIVPDSMGFSGPDGAWTLLNAPIRDAADRMENPERLHTALMESITAKLRPFRLLEQYLGLLAVCALLLGVVVGAFFAHPIAEPLTSLARAAHAIERGDYDVGETLGLAQNPRMQARDEIGVLGRSFLDMARGLKERFAMTKFLSQSTFEQIKQTAGSELPSERRTLAVLFTDIRGFSSYAEKRDPAVVIAILNRVLGMQAQIVQAHQGDVDKFVGDSMVAWFSGPQRCRRALEASREIARQLSAELRNEPGTRVGLGLHVGEVVVGSIGSEHRRDYTAIGATVNLAARLCAAADAGQVLVSAAVQREVDGALPLRPLPPLQFKGFSQPMAVFELADEGRATAAAPE